MSHRPNQSESSKAQREADDAALVQAVRRGDKRAFVEIVTRHQAMVCGIAMGILGDFAASEDAAQESFLTAWRKFHELREPSRLRSWLAQIARNAALGHLRRKRGHESLDEVPAMADESPLPDEVAANDEEAELVRRSLARLPETYRLPLVLYYREGKSVRAVAETLDISEDAVKQRLARGREMLREEISSVMDRVLTRSGPTAVFTMTIAVAIGALATPAAIAGAVFATAAASSVTTAASVSTSPLLTAMSTSKTLLATAAVIVVACVPLGYHLTTSTPPEQPASKSQPTIHPVTSPEKRTPDFENSVMFAEWRQLHDVHGRTADAMPAIYEAIGKLGDPFRRKAFYTALVAEWAQLDPALGLKFFFEKGRNGGHRQQFFDEWLMLDPAAAVKALQEAGPGWENVARQSLVQIALRLPSSVPGIVSQLPKSQSHWDTTVRDAFAIVAKNDLGAALRAAQEISGPNRDSAIAGAVQFWAQTDLRAAIQWAKSLPDGVDRDEIIRAALIGKASVDPVAALELANSVPPGGRQGYFADTTGARILREAAKADYEATAAWIASHPGRFGNEDLLGMAEETTLRMNADIIGFLQKRVEDGSFAALRPAIESALLNDAGSQREGVWEWLKAQPSNDATETLKRNVLSSAAWDDPALAMRLSAEIPQTPEGDERIRSLASSLMNSEGGLNRFTSLLANSPERLRQPIIEAAFQRLGWDRTADPQLWISRLSLLPESGRAKGMESIARTWGTQSPEEALGWVSTLPVGDARVSALGAVASSWAKSDVLGTANWINHMSPGLERDRAAESFATVIAERSPQDAWKWALSISDSGGRTRAATEAAERMIPRDASTARQWVETGPFTDEIRSRLQALLAMRQP
jgi:RNA polymerase sigma factor (sigma-70 family)